jgi:glycogen debranching enzyme
MLNFFSIEAGARVLGGLSIAYLLPFSDLSSAMTTGSHNSFARAYPSSAGLIHLHPAYQQREFVVGDGLHILETFFLPRTGLDDPAVAHTTVSLKNRTPHPIGITVIASLDLRGATPRDLEAKFDEKRRAIVSWNAARPNWVRVFGASEKADRYFVSTDEEEAYSPREPLANLVEGTGDLTGALQLDMILIPGRRKKLRFTATFSPEGEREALRIHDSAATDGGTLKDTIEYYSSILQTAVLETPDSLLSQGAQWAKACLIRPVSRYSVGIASTNDPGNSTHLVGRDTAWYVHGSDFVDPEISCSMLQVFARTHRDGLIAEYIDGNSGETEDHGLNINDNTPLFVMAVAHHVKVTGHRDCLQKFYEPALRAGELILKERDETGLVKCTSDGMGIKAICGWRNVLRNEQITGAVTEVNSECYAALASLSELAEAMGDLTAKDRFAAEASSLRAAINRRLRNPKNGLYLRNIDLEGRAFTQASVDLVFPLICGVADPDTRIAVIARLSAADFMTAAGIRVLPEENPRWNPSSDSGCLGGVWPGATWWYAMSCSHSNPEIVADSLRRSYFHYVSDPRVFNTVPGQFSEWSDGQTLVNRGMRLSPWEAPRFLWAAIEGLAGLAIEHDCISFDPHLPDDWRWLRLHNLPVRGKRLSFFVTRETDGLHVYTTARFKTELIQHHYEEDLPDAVETITTGLSLAAMRAGDETLVCLGSSLDIPALGPFLAHHALASRKRYAVSYLNSLEGKWRDLGAIEGEDLQRIIVRVESHGYALYRFVIA